MTKSIANTGIFQLNRCQVRPTVGNINTLDITGPDAANTLTHRGYKTGFLLHIHYVNLFIKPRRDIKVTVHPIIHAHRADTEGGKGAVSQTL